MACEVEVGTFTAPTSNGAASTVNLTRVTNLKAIILWTAACTADGATDGDAMFSQGFVTNDGGAIQQNHQGYFSDDANAASNTSGSVNTDACLRLLNTPAGAVDGYASCTTFSATQFVLTWTDAPTNAIRVNYMALGGSDITAARAFSFLVSSAVATQDVTVVTGFGKPDLLFLCPNESDTLGAFGGQHGTLEMFVASSATSRRGAAHYDTHGQANMSVGSWQGARALMQWKITTGPQVDAEADLSAKGSWPTDGFQLAYSDQAARTNQVTGLALKGTFLAAIGSDVVPISGSLPVVQDLALGASPSGALLWGTPIATNNGVVSALSGQLGGFMIGAGDGTAEASAGVTQNDADATSSTGRWQNAAKGISEYLPVAAGTNPPTLASEADTSFAGNNFRLSWNDIDTVAREFQYLLIGSGTAPVTVPLAASAGVGSTVGQVVRPEIFSLAAAAGSGTTAGSLTASTRAALAAAVGSASAAMTLTVPVGVPVMPLVSAGAVSAATMQPTVLTGLALSAAAASSGSLRQLRTVTDPYAVAVSNTNGLVLYLRLGEAAGPVAIDEFGHDGTIEGAEFGTAAIAQHAGSNSALTLSGASGIRVPHTASIDTADSVSFECWFARSLTGVREVLFSKSVGGLEVLIDTDNTIEIRKAGTELQVARSTTTVPANRRHHLVVTKNGALVKIYLNGVDVTGTVTNQTLVTNASDIRIGSA